LEIDMSGPKQQAFLGFLGIVGIAGLVSAALVSLGCSSSNKAGSPGTGGAAGGVGGKAGTTGGGGTGGGGGDASMYGCAVSDPPPSALIADFASLDGGIEVTGSLSTYGSNAVDHPTYDPTGGSLNIMDAVVPGSNPQYVGLVLTIFGNSASTDCLDASAYTGVQFSLSGTVSAGCPLSYSTQDSEHSPVVLDPPDGGMPVNATASGPVGAYGSSYAPQFNFTPAMITTAPQTIKIAFTDFSQDGLPADVALDPKKITGMQWQMTVPAIADGGPGECDLNITIDNVMFYK
jgi:hypothetical protein